LVVVEGVVGVITPVQKSLSFHLEVTMRNILALSFLMLAPAAFAQAEIPAGSYVSADSTYLIDDEVVVVDWAPGLSLVKATINYTQYEAHFAIPVHQDATDPTLFSGSGALISGSCSWNMDLAVYHVGDQLFVQLRTPQAIYDDCSAEASNWEALEAPFTLRQ
jgi:hypothetical protein